jgi:subtilisin family serine protease
MVILKKWLLPALAGLLFTSSATALAVTKPSATTGVDMIVVKDPVSGAVILKNGNAYYYQDQDTKDPVQRNEIAPRQILVKYKGAGAAQTKNFEAVAKTSSRFSGSTQKVNDSFPLALVKLAKDADYFPSIQELRQNPAVEYVEPNYVVRASSAPNDPYYAKQWGLPAIHADLAWDKVPASQRDDVIIAVLDTGVNASHEDLKQSLVAGYDFASNDTVPDDQNGHGTHVAGIAAAIGNNGVGVSGVAAGARIMPVKVLSNNGSGDLSSIINGIRYATDHGAQVINMSLGGSGTSQAMQDAISYALSKGVVVVAASGNSNGPVGFPGNCSGVVTVGAIDSSGTRASYSNYGPELDVVAPGSNIFSTFMGSASSYITMSGTSMAAPAVSGVAALVKAINPALAATAVEDILRRSATDKGSAGFDNYYGWGLVDANRAVDLAKSQPGAPAPSQPTPSPAPVPEPQPNPNNNLALGKPATASSVEGNTRAAWKAVDGDPGTRWASQPEIDPQWIAVDLGKRYGNLTKIVLRWENAYARSYRVQVSDDGTNWATIYTTNHGSGGITTLTGSVSGRYVRIYGTQRGTPYGYSLWELEVYGS